MPDSLLLFTAFSLGLLGSTHCLGMCGGINGALAFALQQQVSAGRRWGYLLLYQLGRISSYALMAALLGLAVELAGLQLNLLTPLRWLAGVLLILMGLYLAGWSSALTVIEKVGFSLWQRLQQAGAQDKGRQWLADLTVPRVWLLGMLWGWLPCGLVYSSLSWSATAGSWHGSALLMTLFGLGTLPMMLVTGAMAMKLRSWLQARQVRAVLGVLVMLFGVWTLVGVMGQGHGGHAEHSVMGQGDEHEHRHH